MKSNLSLIIGLSLLIGLGACKKESTTTTPEDSSLPTSIFDLKVKEDFNFKSTRDIQMRVQVQKGNYAGEVYRINVYDDFPTIANMLTSGITKVGDDLELAFRIPSALEYVYIEKVASTGARELQRISAANYIAANFNNSPTLMLKNQPSSGLNCTTGCSTTYNNWNSGNLNLTTAGVYCLTGTFNGSINIGTNVTVRICGTANITGITMGSSSSKLYFLENSIVVSSNLNMNNSAAIVYNFSDSLKFTGSISPGGIFENNGKMAVHGDLSVNNNGSNYFTNNGEIYVQSNLNNNKTLTNNNKIYVNGMLQPNGGSTTTNNCQIISVGDYNNNSTFHNYGYIKCYAETKINGGSTLYNYGGSLLSTEDIILNGTINGPTSNGLGTVKVGDFTRINGGGTLSGTVELCDSTGVNVNNGNINSPATLSCGNYIATSACNPEGFGTAQVTDTDGDGVADNIDDYPNDATRAYNSYYPSASTYTTLGFEDLWPSQGDYDFNDLVLGYRTKKVLNASNKVVEMYNTYLVRAIGATFDNGFGFQLDDVTPNEISSITGQRLSKNMISLNSNNTETNQNKAVVIVYDTPEPFISRAGGSFFNTVKTNGTGTFDTVNIYVAFTSPIASSKLTQGKYNPFIFVNGSRGVEVHLPDFVPTGNANTQLLGTKNDSSNPNTGRYYKTSNNLPFVIEVPNTFSYPAEKEAISDAYTYFITWAASSGASYTNWYENISGYRNTNKIY